MKFKRFFKSIIAPVLAALVIFLIARPVLAELVTSDIDFAQSLVEGNVEVGVETVNGYSQVYYLRDGKKHFVTEGNRNSHQPHSAGEYITYVTTINGAGQIFLYNITADTTVQLTNSLTNLKPKVSKEGRVVWERWVDDPSPGGWQVALFDGTTIRRLTEGEVSINPDIDGDYVVFSTKDADGLWRAMGYSVAKDEVVTINVGIEAKSPKLEKEQIFLQDRAEPLKITDLFLLGDAPTPSPTPTPFTEEVAAGDIKEELDAQPIEEEGPGE